MTHPVHSLQTEDFELLVGLIYQRQGYRISMPAGRSGGRGGDFMVQRKSERLLVQCKKLSPDYKVPVDRVRELHEAAVAAGATRGVYVASCGFSWDARNFAKTKGVTVINARMLDTLLTGAREKPDEDFLAVSEWAPKLMSKVKLTPPLCPACEAPMDEINVSSGSVWVCSQRPECRGRRSARKSHKPMPVAASDAAPKAYQRRKGSIKRRIKSSIKSAAKGSIKRHAKGSFKRGTKGSIKSDAKGSTKRGAQRHASKATPKPVSKAVAKGSIKCSRKGNIKRGRKSGIERARSPERRTAARSRQRMATAWRTRADRLPFDVPGTLNRPRDSCLCGLNPENISSARIPFGFEDRSGTRLNPR